MYELTIYLFLSENDLKKWIDLKFREILVKYIGQLFDDRNNSRISPELILFCLNFRKFQIDLSLPSAETNARLDTVDAWLLYV